MLPPKPTSGLCELDLGISEGFRQKPEYGWGEAFFGDAAVREQYLHTLALAHHAPLRQQTLLRRDLGFKVLASPSHIRLPSLLLMFKMLRFRLKNQEC